MTGGKILDRIRIELRDQITGDLLPVMIDIYDNSLSRKWLTALNHLLKNNYHLEKNYCFFGFVDHRRDGPYILDQVNRTIESINRADLGYNINDYFSIDNTITDEPIGSRKVGRNLIHEKLNWLHRYFEDLQGVSGSISPFYQRADSVIRWHIRQLNLLCHEFESWALSYRKQIEAPDWQRPSTLFCWLNAPRFTLDPEDYELFAIHTLSRPLGGVFVGVNKAVGKHHWEVFNDEGKDSRIDELITTTLKSQTEAAGDFDIEWGQDPSGFDWQKKKLSEFRQWLLSNGFDPDDKSLTIGHPQIGQVDLESSFGTKDHRQIWNCLNNHLNVAKITTSEESSTYDYCWSDPDYAEQQIREIKRNER